MKETKENWASSMAIRFAMTQPAFRHNVATTRSDDTSPIDLNDKIEKMLFKPIKPKEKVSKLNDPSISNIQVLT